LLYPLSYRPVNNITVTTLDHDAFTN